MLHRTKLLAASLAVLVAGATALFLAAPASAAEWHLYKGDVFAGHAYGLQVPSDAESFEVAWSGPENGTASVAIFDPAGVRLSHYALGPSLTSAVVVSPVEGQYVLFVYELTDGALNVRVHSPIPPMLDLQKLQLAREDVPVATLDEPARLDKAFSTTLKATPVFATLLYEGSVRDLDATVSGAKGAALTVTDETGTAFAPGVYSSLGGSRRMDAANLDGATYTVEVHAESFEGTLFLTTLAIEKAAPATTPPTAPPAKTPAPPQAPQPPAAWTAPGASPTFAFEERKAYAFAAKAGELLLADPMMEDETHGDGHEERYYDVYDAVSIYTPDDKLLAYVVLEHQGMNASVKLPADGEYVAYVHQAHDDVVLAKLSGVSSAPTLRELRLVEETFEYRTDALLLMGPGGDGVEFELTRAPVAMLLEGSEESLEALTDASVHREDGVTVATYSAFLRLPGTGGAFAWTSVDPEAFQAGKHTLQADGLLGASLTLTALSYDRDLAPLPVEEEVTAEEDGEEEDSEPTPPPTPLGTFGELLEVVGVRGLFPGAG